LVDKVIDGDTHIYLHNMQTKETTLVSASSQGEQGYTHSFDPSISADGRFVVFDSASDNLVAHDTNHVVDVFMREIGTLPASTPAPRARAASLPSTGFAAGRISNLPEQPATKAYTDEGMILNIPALGLKTAIVGVPKDSEGGWDVSWLGNSIGYLSGTAFPTWAGNSVLTGHVYNADGQPGPFVHLDRLKWGQQMVIQAWGQQYIYEVRSVETRVSPSNTSALTKHEAYPWLTLITCQGYDEKTDSYRWRTVVRAVLVKVQDQP
jgi:LPXTG-site transpeptidase (sortase) family protein